MALLLICSNAFAGWLALGERANDIYKKSQFGKQKKSSGQREYERKKEENRYRREKENRENREKNKWYSNFGGFQKTVVPDYVKKQHAKQKNLLR